MEEEEKNTNEEIEDQNTRDITSLKANFDILPLVKIKKYPVKFNPPDECPNTGGIYFLFNKDEEILYIGKSNELRTRLSQHLSEHTSARYNPMTMEPKIPVTWIPLGATYFVSWISCNEKDVEILEKLYQTQYNVIFSNGAVAEEMLNYITNNEIQKVNMRLELSPSDKEGIRVAIRRDGRGYSVREHRLIYFMPDIWKKFYNALPTTKSKLTAEVLVQLGARINEARHIREDDIDYDRNTIKLRITKTKAKKGETHGKPRTIPVNSKFIKSLKKHFLTKKEGELIGILSTGAFNIALKKTLKGIGVKDYYMYSPHNIRKTHGNWLKVMGNLNIMQVDAMEICLRLGHDYDTFLKDYGSPGVMDNRDILIIRDILGDLYQR